MYKRDVIKSLRIMNRRKPKEVYEFLGISKATYSKYENGIYPPSLDTLSKIANFYDVDPSVFFISDILMQIDESSSISEICHRISVRMWERYEVAWNLNEDREILTDNEYNKYFEALKKLHNRIEELKIIAIKKMEPESIEEFLDKEDYWEINKE